MRDQAIILFIRAERTEAAAKPLPGRHGAAGYRAVNRRMAERLRPALAAHADLVVVAEHHCSMPHAAHVLPQHGAGFGERITNAVTDTLALGYHRVVIVGNDCPTLSPGDIEAAFTGLAGGAAYAAAPARDGGAYLIGVAGDSFSPAAFGSLPWRTASLFAALLHLEGAVAVADVRDDFDEWASPAARRALDRFLAFRQVQDLRPSIAHAPGHTRRRAKAITRIHLPAPPPRQLPLR